MKPRILLTALLMTLTLSSCDKPTADAPTADRQETLKIDHAWIREAPPGMQMMAGYLSATNNGDQEIAILSATSPAFGAIELHKTEVIDGTARMIEQKKLPIPPHGSLEMKPGSYHMMLMMPAHPLKAGEHVMMTLKLDDGSSRQVDYEVRKE